MTTSPTSDPIGPTAAAAIARYRAMVRAYGPGFHPDTEPDDHETLPDGYTLDDIVALTDRVRSIDSADVYGLALDALEDDPPSLVERLAAAGVLAPLSTVWQGGGPTERESFVLDLAVGTLVGTADTTPAGRPCTFVALYDGLDYHCGEAPVAGIDTTDPVGLVKDLLDAAPEGTDRHDEPPHLITWVQHYLDEIVPALPLDHEQRRGSEAGTWCPTCGGLGTFCTDPDHERVAPPDAPAVRTEQVVIDADTAAVDAIDAITGGGYRVERLELLAELSDRGVPITARFDIVPEHLHNDVHIMLRAMVARDRFRRGVRS